MALSYTPSFLYRFPSTHSTWHGFLPPFAYKDGRPISRDHTPNRTCPSNAMHRKRFDTTWIYMSESHIDAVVRTSCILHYIAFKPDTQLELHGQNTRCKHAAAMLSDTCRKQMFLSGHDVSEQFTTHSSSAEGLDYILYAVESSVLM